MVGAVVGRSKSFTSSLLQFFDLTTENSVSESGRWMNGRKRPVWPGNSGGPGGNFPEVGVPVQYRRLFTALLQDVFSCVPTVLQGSRSPRV